MDLDMGNSDPAVLHRRAWDAIPWLVAGSASPDDRKLLQQHLPDCAECRQELAFQQRVQAGLHAGVPDMPSPEPGLQRLLARLDLGDATGGLDAPHVLPAQPAPQPQPSPRRAAGNWTRWLVAAVVVQAVGLGAAGLALVDLQRGDGGRVDAVDAGYRTLSTPAGTTAAATVRLVPAQSLDFAALRRLLLQTRLAVVEAAPDGSSLGLAPLDGDPRTSAAALPLLRAQPGVLLAEPTGK